MPEALMTRATTDKSSKKLIINSLESLRQVSGEILALWREHKYLVLSIRVGRDRSIEQNKLWRAMYKRVAQTLQQGTDDEVWHYCKLMVGIPILIRDDEQFESLWNQFFAELDFERQLYMMGPNPLFGPEGFRVTSLFGTAQGREYTDAIVRHYAPHGVLFEDLLSDGK